MSSYNCENHSITKAIKRKEGYSHCSKTVFGNALIIINLKLYDLTLFKRTKRKKLNYCINIDCLVCVCVRKC